MKDHAEGQVATSRKPADANLARVQIQLRRLRSQNVDGLASVRKDRRKIGVPCLFPVIVVRAIVGTVLQHQRGDALGFEPECQVMALAIEPHHTVTAARADH
jgi:hypothetical protein